MEDASMAQGIPLIPDGMSTMEYLNHMGPSVASGVPSFNEQIPLNTSMHSHDVLPIMSPFSMDNHTNEPINHPMGDEYHSIDDLINGLEGLGSADMVMMDNNIQGEEGLQRDDSFWKQLFIQTNSDKNNNGHEFLPKAEPDFRENIAVPRHGD